MGHFPSSVKELFMAQAEFRKEESTAILSATFVPPCLRVEKNRLDLE
jgi:hypothetical protein